MGIDAVYSRFTILLVVAAAFSACTPPGPSSPDPVTEAPLTDPNVAAAISPKAAFTIGDAETSLNFEIRADRELRIHPRIRISEVETQTGRLASVQIDVMGEPPERFPLLVTVVATRSFLSHSGRILGQVKFEDQEVFPVSGVMGENALQTPMTGRLELISRVGSLPDSALVIGEAEVILYRDTDPATVDREAPAPENAERVTIYSNPVRINIHRQAAPAAPEGASN
jgi:hypothetical protein